MSIIESITLFGILVALAAIPSTSVALVVARSSTLGVANGIAVAAEIVLGDLVFIMLAILGLSVVAETMGSLLKTTLSPLSLCHAPPIKTQKADKGSACPIRASRNVAG